MARGYVGVTESVADPKGWTTLIPVLMIVLLTVAEWGGVIVLVRSFFSSSTAYHWVAPGVAVDEPFR
jgi:hypothetical protein